MGPVLVLVMVVEGGVVCGVGRELGAERLGALLFLHMCVEFFQRYPDDS